MVPVSHRIPLSSRPIPWLLLGLATLGSGHLFAQEAKPKPLEERACRALAACDRQGLAVLAQEVAALSTATQASHAFRIREGELQLRFRGEYPNESLGGGPRDSRRNPFVLEYLVGPRRVREDELLLAVDGAQMARVQTLGKALRSLQKRGLKPRLRVQLVWVDGGRARVEDLRDILRLTKSPERRRYMQGLRVFARRGLGANNVLADLTVLPGKRCPAEVHVSVLLP